MKIKFKSFCGLLAASLMLSLGFINLAPKAQTTGLDVYEAYTGLGNEKRVLRANEEEEVVVPEALGKLSQVKSQITDETDGKRSIRFVAGVDSPLYNSAGFNITIKSGTEVKKQYQFPVSKVFTGIQANDEILTPESVFGDDYHYVFVYALVDVPAEANNWSFIVSPYIKNNEHDVVSEARNLSVQDNIFLDDPTIKELNLTQFSPYNDSYITISWSNNFVSGDMQNVKKDIDAYFITKDGFRTAIDGETENTHINGGTDGKSINFHAKYPYLPAFSTCYQEYSVRIVITLSNGDRYMTTRDFEIVPLGQVQNVSVSQDFVLSFDNMTGVSKYVVTIYNETYEGKPIDFVNGSKLPVTTLGVGTYNLRISAVALVGFTSSETIVSNAFTISSSIAILDGNDIYDLSFINLMNIRPDLKDAWERIVKITWHDDAQKASGANPAIIDFEIHENGNLKNAFLLAWGDHSSKEEIGYADYRTFAFKLDSGFNTSNNSVYQISFVLKSDDAKNPLYSITKTFYSWSLFNAVELYWNDFQRDIITHARSLDENDYSSANWNDIKTTTYQALADTNPEFSSDTTAMEDIVLTYKDTISVIPTKNLPVLSMVGWSVEASDETLGAASNIINSGGRWETTHKKDPQWLIVDMKSLYDVYEFRVDWEGASAKKYTVEFFSTNPGAPTFSDNLQSDFENSSAEIKISNGTGARIDIFEFETAYRGQFIRIIGYERSTVDYGYSIWNIVVKGYPAHTID